VWCSLWCVLLTTVLDQRLLVQPSTTAAILLFRITFIQARARIWFLSLRSWMGRIILLGLVRCDARWEARASFILSMVRFLFHHSMISIIMLGNAVIISSTWITNSVSSQIAQSMVFIENVHDVWNELKERFSKADRIRVSKLRSDINNLKQGSLSLSF
jgi:hypothetical protein